LFLFFLFIIICISFITILERHSLALRQYRIGPNKAGFVGMLQAVFDGLKLFKKDVVKRYYSYGYYFFFIPALSFLLLFIQ
jgi:NADH-quinone oxidoreductase subunit H